MREILFRGKCFDKECEWAYGSLINDGDYTYIGGRYSDVRVISETVGQYTGLIDKIGMKIFEGDLVHIHDTMLQCTMPLHEFDGHIDFADGSYRVVSGDVPHYRWLDYDVEVIGNIYDNPELLKNY